MDGTSPLPNFRIFLPVQIVRSRLQAVSQEGLQAEYIGTHENPITILIHENFMLKWKKLKEIQRNQDLGHNQRPMEDWDKKTLTMSQSKEPLFLLKLENYY